MKKLVSVILAVAMIFGIVGIIGCAAGDEGFALTMQIDNPVMTVNGTEQEIDAGMGTTPVIRNERTLVPIRAIIEAMGGTVGWEAETRTATLELGEDEIRLVINSETAYLNNEPQTLDSVPVIINERTMLPIRFIAEGFKFDVDWNGPTQTITIARPPALQVQEDAKRTSAVSKPAENSESSDALGERKGVIVVYFSRTGEQYGAGTVDKGNTAIVADMIAEEVNADKFEIMPKEDNYPTTYDALTEVAKQEQNDNARPEIASRIDNFDRYETVFLGYPIWWGDMPMIVYTFLEGYDFEGKTVIPFCTHAGSGLSGTVSDIEKALPDARVRNGLAVEGTDAQKNKDKVSAAVQNWIESLGE